MKKIELNKKTVFKIILWVLLAALVAVGIYGTVLGIKDNVEQKQKEENTTEATTKAFPLTGTEKTFEYENMKITLTEDFEVFEDPVIDIGYVAQGIKIFISKESFEDFPETKGLTLQEYAKQLVENNGEDPDKIVFEDGFCYCNFLYNGSGQVESYTVCMYEDTDGFWIAHFITSYKSADAYEANILKWAKSVVIE